MNSVDSVRTDYALTFLVDTARDSDINPDQINKCHGLVADELTRLREENARLMAVLFAGRTLQAQHDRVGIGAPISMLNQNGEAATFFEALAKVPS